MLMFLFLRSPKASSVPSLLNAAFPNPNPFAGDGIINLHIWDIFNPEKVKLQIIKIKGLGFGNAAFSNDGTLLALGDLKNKNISILGAKKGKFKVLKTIEKFNENPLVSFSHNDQLFASGNTYTGSINIWYTAKDGNFRKLMDLKANKPLTSLAFQPEPKPVFLLEMEALQREKIEFLGELGGELGELTEEQKRDLKVIKNIGSKLDSINRYLKRASKTLYGEEANYNSAEVQRLGFVIERLKNLISTLKEDESFRKILRMDENDAEAWEKLLENIVKIATKWHILFDDTGDEGIDFKTRTAPQEKINYYGNKWYDTMKETIEASIKQLEKLKKIEKIETIKIIKKYYVLLQTKLQTMYKTMLKNLHRVYYVLGAYAGGISRAARGTPLYRYPIFTPQQPETKKQ